MQNFKSSTAIVVELRFFLKIKKKMKMKNLENHVFLYFIPCVIFLCMQLLLHLDVLRRQIEIENESENCNFLM